MITSRFWSRFVRGVPKGAPLILTIASVAGVVATGVLSARAQLKADIILAKHGADLKYMSKSEKVAEVWTNYIPAVAIGAGTCAAIIVAEMINKKHIAALAGAAAAMSKTYISYKNKVKEYVDEETQQKIEDAIRLEAIEVPEDAGAHAAGCYNAMTDDLPHGDNDTLFFESWSKRFFRSSVLKVQNAEYHLNRNYILRGFVTMNEWYDFLGLDKTGPGENMGWTDEAGMDWGFSWIDFEHMSSRTSAGTPFYVIRYPFEPCFIP